MTEIKKVVIDGLEPNVLVRLFLMCQPGGFGFSENLVDPFRGQTSQLKKAGGTVDKLIELFTQGRSYLTKYFIPLIELMGPKNGVNRIFLDRWFTATMAYQGGNNKDKIREIFKLHREAGVLIPDEILIVLLNIEMILKAEAVRGEVEKEGTGGQFSTDIEKKNRYQEGYRLTAEVLLKELGPDRVSVFDFSWTEDPDIILTDVLSWYRARFGDPDEVRGLYPGNKFLNRGLNYLGLEDLVL